MDRDDASGVDTALPAHHLDDGVSRHLEAAGTTLEPPGNGDGLAFGVGAGSERLVPEHDLDRAAAVANRDGEHVTTTPDRSRVKLGDFSGDGRFLADLQLADALALR